jgi:hypothetical protein
MREKPASEQRVTRVCRKFTYHPARVERPGPARGTVKGGNCTLCPGRVAIVTSVYYEIRVGGTLPPDALLDFERLMVSVEPVKTVLHGPIPDQAALNGLLARLELFGAEVVEVRRLQDGPASSRAE